MFLHSPVSLAHFFWKGLLQPGDKVLDATCGAGKDSEALAGLCLSEEAGELHLIDVQKEAVERARARLETALSPSHLGRISFYNQCHSELEDFERGAFKLVVYNLGYLPGSDKTLITQSKSTLKSLERALLLLCEGGQLSITCYPGHPGGSEEAAAVIDWAKSLGHEYLVCHHSWINRSKGAPHLLLVERKLALP